MPRSTAASAASPTLKRFHGPLVDAPATVAACVAGSVNAGFASASANFVALPNRSAASFSNAFAAAAATLGGTDLRSSVTGRGVSVTIFMMICCADEPTCGGLPVNISYNTLPSE